MVIVQFDELSLLVLLKCDHSFVVIPLMFMWSGEINACEGCMCGLKF